MQINSGDILICANGEKREIGANSSWLLRDYYDENLNCTTNPDFNIVQILRPEYKVIYSKEEEKSVRKNR